MSQNTDNGSQNTTSTYVKIVNLITKHTVVASAIMVLALGTLGVSAAQLLAPDQYKPFRSSKTTPVATTISSNNTTTDTSNNTVSEDKKVDSAVNTAQNTTTPTKTTATSEEKWTGKITLAPKNTKDLEKYTTSKEFCDNLQLGIVSYSSQSADANIGEIVITNKNIQISQSQKDEFNKVANQINKKADFPKTIDNYAQTESTLFANSCSGGGYSNYIQDIAGVEYKNVDSYRVLMINYGNGVYGGPTVRIFAQKGDNLIATGKAYVYSKSESVANSCGLQTKFDNNCYMNKLKADKQLKTDLDKAAQELVQTFAL